MFLDRTNIAIRQRSLLECYDLAVHIVREHTVPLVVALVVGALPWGLLNVLLLRTFIDENAPLAYLMFLLILTVAQAQLGTVFITSFLGQAVFNERPTPRLVFRLSVQQVWRLLWSQGLFRLVLPITLLTVLMDFRRDDAIFNMWMLLMVLLFIALIVRGFRTFIVEIIILEKPPTRPQPTQGLSFSERNASLHQATAVDLLIASWLAAPLGAGMALSLHGLFFYRGLVTNSWGYDNWSYFVLIPCAFWLSAGFLAVVRFLNYIDTRIRQEGWDIELKLKACGRRLDTNLHEIRGPG